MKKVIIIGCPGSGKSTFARELHEAKELPICYLDMLFWNEDGTSVDKQLFRDRLSEVLEKEAWIIDGNYESTMELRIKACDTVFFLDYPLDVCIDGVMSRRGKERADMPWVEATDTIDEAFMQFIKDYQLKNKPKVMELLDKYKEKEIIIFHNREETKKYLSRLR